MKFGKQLEKQQVAAWADKYVQYKLLKKQLKAAESAREVVNAKQSASAADAQNAFLTIFSCSQAFITLLDSDLRKVCAFVVELQQQLDATREHVEQARKAVEQATDDSSHAQNDLDAMERTLWNASHQLASYVELNYTAFYKAGKKHDKVTGLRLSSAIMGCVDRSLLGIALHGSKGDSAVTPLPEQVSISADGSGMSVPSILAAVGYDGAVSVSDMPRLFAEAAAEGDSDTDEYHNRAHAGGDEDSDAGAVASGVPGMHRAESWRSQFSEEGDADASPAVGPTHVEQRLGARIPSVRNLVPAPQGAVAIPVASTSSSALSKMRPSSQLFPSLPPIHESHGSDVGSDAEGGNAKGTERQRAGSTAGRGDGVDDTDEAPASLTSSFARARRESGAAISMLDAIASTNMVDSQDHMTAAAELLTATGYPTSPSEDLGLPLDLGPAAGAPASSATAPLTRIRSPAGCRREEHSSSAAAAATGLMPVSPMLGAQSHINTMTAAGLVALLAVRTRKRGDSASAGEMDELSLAPVLEEDATASASGEGEGAVADPLQVALKERLQKQAKQQGGSKRSLTSLFGQQSGSEAKDPVPSGASEGKSWHPMALAPMTLPTVLQEASTDDEKGTSGAESIARRSSFPSVRASAMSAQGDALHQGPVMVHGTARPGVEVGQDKVDYSQGADDAAIVRSQAIESLLSAFDTSLADMHKSSEQALVAACPELEGDQPGRVKERLKRMARYTLELLHARSRVRDAAGHRSASFLEVSSAVLAEKLLLVRLQLKLLASAVEQTSPESAGALEIVISSQHALLREYMSASIRAPTQHRAQLANALVKRKESASSDDRLVEQLGKGGEASKHGDRAEKASGLQGQLSDDSAPESPPRPGARHADMRHSTSESELERLPQRARPAQASGSAGTGLNRRDGRLSSMDSADILRSDTRLMTSPGQSVRGRAESATWGHGTHSAPALKDAQSRRVKKMARLFRTPSELEAAQALGLAGVLKQATDMVPAVEADAEAEGDSDSGPSRRNSASSTTKGKTFTTQKRMSEVRGRAAVLAAAAAATAELRQALNIGNNHGPTVDGPAWLSTLVSMLDLASASNGHGHASSPVSDPSRPYVPGAHVVVKPRDIPLMVWRRYRPAVMDWLPTEYKPVKTLPKDIIAGVTIGVMLVPQGLACATLAGLPPQYGLWSGMIPAAMYFLMGTSKHAAVGPMSVPALLLAAGVGNLDPSSPEEHARMVLSATFMAGILYVLMGWTGTGFITRFVSRPVLSGFQSAAAVLTMVSVAKDALGVTLPRASVLQDQLAGLFSSNGIPRTNLACLFTTLTALAVLLGAPKVPKLKVIPSPLITVLVFVALFGLITVSGASTPVALVGYIPSGWPTPMLPLPRSTTEFASLAPVAVSVAIVGLLEHLAVSSNYALKHGYEWSINSELKALGAGNALGAALGGSMFTAGAFGRSAVFDTSGGKTQVGQLVSAATVVLLQLAVLPALAYLPRAALAAIIAVSVSKLIDIKGVAALWKIDPKDGLILLTALLATLFAGVLEGVLFAALASLVLFLAQTTRPVVEELGRLSGTVLYQSLGSLGVEAVQGVKILRFLAPLFYANSPVLKERILAELANRRNAPPRMRFRALVLCFSAVATVDSTAIALLKECLAEAHSQGVMVLIASAHPLVIRALDRAGIVVAMGGPAFLTRRVHEAVRSVLMKKVTKGAIPAMVAASGKESAAAASRATAGTTSSGSAIGRRVSRMAAAVRAWGHELAQASQEATSARHIELQEVRTAK